MATLRPAACLDSTVANRTLACILLASLIASTTVAARDASVTIRNESNWDIYQLFLSSTSDSHWGHDQLGTQIIESGESFRLRRIPCDHYDVRIVDEDGDVCVLEGVRLCGDREVWSITDADLLACQLLTEE
jgi:hypothetical protein